MDQALHGSASTTVAVRRAIQDNQESLRVLAKRHGISPKTVAKWRSRQNTVDILPDPANDARQCTAAGDWCAALDEHGDQGAAIKLGSRDKPDQVASIPVPAHSVSASPLTLFRLLPGAATAIVLELP